MTYNIEEGGGDDRRFDLVLQVIERASPDLLVINEGVGWFPSDERADRIAETLGATYRIAQAVSNFDVGLFSRFPIRTLHQSHGTLLHAVAWIEVDLGEDETFTLVGAHLDYREESRRFDEIESVSASLEPLAYRRAALLGDLNAIAPGDEVLGFSWEELKHIDRGDMPEWFEARYPPRAVTALFALGWVDGFRTINPRDAGYTMSTSEPNARYDHVLVSRPLAPYVMHAEVVTAPPAANASDHFPVIVDLDFTIGER